MANSQNSPKTTTGPIGIFPKEKNPIGSVVTEILRDEQTDIILLCIIDNYILGWVDFGHFFSEAKAGICK